MYDIIKTDVFTKWANKLDPLTKSRIFMRIQRLQNGNFGDVKVVARGVCELRIHLGPGYRVYFMQYGNIIIVLLCGGDKKSQAKDIKVAKLLVDTYSD